MYIRLMFVARYGGRRVSSDPHGERYYKNDFIYRLYVASKLDVLILRERAPNESERSWILTFCARSEKVWMKVQLVMCITEDFNLLTRLS